ncbi:MAG: glycosyltransferase [Synechococcales cyanobacterium RM1_1_8]|nr:glycosyltransferase [Synechococcales cyanobacterium RM1_1_8]
MTVSTPDISVVIPVYNGDRYIKTAIQSVLNQKNCTF